jgi:hypothetical protein
LAIAASAAAATAELNTAASKMPLSGDVVQSIDPFTMLFGPIGSQSGLANINLG